MVATYAYDPTRDFFSFEKPLVQATILRRPNRFIVEALVEGEVERVHCPVTGSIGGFTLDGLQCLLRGPADPGRATRWTLSAVALGEGTTPEKPVWLGVDQTAVNSYIEALLLENRLPELIVPTTVKREQRLGSSRLDFLVNSDTFVEVKLPLREIQVSTPTGVPRKTFDTLGAADRMLKQMLDMEAALADGQQAAIISTFIYDNPGFKVAGKWNPLIFNAVSHAREAGVSFWQLNLAIIPEGFQRTHFAPRQPQQIVPDAPQ